jgi:OmcA/MtrC family decaheme c-type cytochrome
MGRQTGSARAFGRAAVALSLVALACQEPIVGERDAGAVASAGPKLTIDDATLDLHGHVVATFTVTQRDAPLGVEAVTTLEPRFTLATLTDHPVDGLRTWKSQLLTGRQVAARLPPAGPGTPDPDVVTSARQPGSETPQSIVELGVGRYRYVFANALTGLDADETIRVGAWLEGAPAASLATSATFDFRPSGGPVEARDTVLDANCVRCHGNVVAHETIAGVRLCLTCHTWQNTDPDTVDPAALVTSTTTPSTDPNPLELGRMLHRIHRGKDLPTVYASTWDPAGSSTVPSAQPLPLPFFPTRSGATVRNLPIVGRRYSIVGDMGREVVFAQALNVSTSNPAIGTMAIVAGGMFPRDLRDCAVCHGDAPQAYEITYAISRRTCSGCHPEIWYQSSSPAADRARFPHPGGPQADDAQCLGCHVTGTPKLYAPIVEVHVPPARADRYSKPVIEIVRIEDLAPGKQPKVTFRLWDRVGPIVPQPNAPVPAWEPDGPTSSYVARRLNAITIRTTGPTTPDYANVPTRQISSGAAGGNPDPLALSTTSGTDEYVYTFSSIIPPGASGTWMVAMEARRTSTPPHYDRTNDVFRWPYTGEPISETAENRIVYVNTASGVWPPPAGSPDPVPRRTVVDQEKCLRCHDRIEFHSSARHEVAYCVSCHTSDRTDLDKRPRLYPGGPVNIPATYDGIEERSTHFKVMMHRIHTGGRRGVASLEGIAPFAIYFSKAYFFDRGGYPNDLGNCTACHAGKSYLVDALPADAPPTIANETPTIRHQVAPSPHAADEPATPPIQTACLGCHATGATFAHVAAKTVSGVETCANCHEKGPVSVDVAHGLAPPSGGVGTTFSSIVEGVLVPRCATAACHSGSPPVAFPALDADVAWGAIVGVPSGQAGMSVVEPGAPERSYLLYKLRGDAGAAGGSVATPMPIGGDTPLDAADIAAIEAWILNGAPND